MSNAYIYRHKNYKPISKNNIYYDLYTILLLTKTTAAQIEDALSYLRGRGLYFPAVVFVRSLYNIA